eukprot:CAMPEP_0181128852 /NCGR_PEP_ID=MMETSP1071-20121207/28996_1 /TAXON_ID=35127 /ORGANISM="Thalassiosira sp., Strain NH16" /LENGTH=592 /DNA_ID=CAMNT_0023214773 /DNA_START=156 /DNA_END=1934 /DNA_ORIENTATION=-
MALHTSLRALAVLMPLLMGKCCHAISTNGEEARWLVKSSKWATLSWLEGEDKLQSLVMSIASSDEGRIFMYLMEDITFKASLTFSEAQLDPSQFFGAKCGPDGVLDPQDPRCAKLTVSGIVSPVKEADAKQHALDVLFAAHPQMASWPTDHNFIPCEMAIHEDDGLWMIANFGIASEDFLKASPVRHANEGFSFGGSGDDRNLAEAEAKSAACYNPDTHECECLDEKCGDANCSAAGGMWSTECTIECECWPDAFTAPADGSDTAVAQHQHGGHEGHGGKHEGDHEGHGGEHGGGHEGHGGDDGGDHEDHGEDDISFSLLPRPDFGSDHVGHARWMVAKSLWSTLSTISSKDNEQPFGNIRSVVDGMCLMASTGLPVFYLPSPDPSSVDIKSNKKVALSFTESVLAETLGSDGNPCGGKDAEDPTCAKLTLIGHANPITDKAQIERAKEAFKANHPRASWLSKGGAHTGGNYYTLHLLEIMFLQNFGGFTHITPEQYLEWKPDASKLPGEMHCAGEYDSSDGQLQQQQQSVTASASISFSAIVFIMIASFIGSFVGGVFSDKLKQSWYGRRNAGYTEANSAENSLGLKASVV